jgi:hypothetical protein
MPGKTATAANTIGELAARLSDDLVKLDNELSEVDVLITQARSEAGRHEARRAAADEKLAALTAAVDAKDRVDLATSPTFRCPARSLASSWGRRRTCAGRSPGRCTTARPRA